MDLLALAATFVLSTTLGLAGSMAILSGLVGLMGRPMA